MRDDRGGDASTATDAWVDACGRLERLGARLLADDFPTGADDRAEGVAHLTQQLLCWAGWSVSHADARRPAFQRQNDLVTPWGGPNADNVYRHARVEASRRYRISGRMHSCEDFVLAVRAGFMHQPTWGTLHQMTASDLGIGEGADFELLLGGDDAGPNWVPLPEGAAMVSIREYYFDWRAQEPAVITIECIDDDAAAPGERLGPDAVAERLADAVSGTEHSVEYWNRYLREHRASATDNEFAPPMKVAKGLATARYGFCFWDLDDDQALVVETDAPPARYWSFQLYVLGWYELLDPVARQTSLNHTQTAIDADGRVRVVLAHHDPGVANWLDVGGRRAGLLTLRWFWPQGDPTPSTQVVPLEALGSVLPDTTARVDRVQRAAAMAHRRRHLAWRFRT